MAGITRQAICQCAAQIVLFVLALCFLWNSYYSINHNGPVFVCVFGIIGVILCLVVWKLNPESMPMRGRLLSYLIALWLLVVSFWVIFRVFTLIAQ